MLDDWFDGLDIFAEQLGPFTFRFCSVTLKRDFHVDIDKKIFQGTVIDYIDINYLTGTMTISGTYHFNIKPIFLTVPK